MFAPDSRTHQVATTNPAVIVSASTSRHHEAAEAIASRRRRPPSLCTALCSSSERIGRGRIRRGRSRLGQPSPTVCIAAKLPDFFWLKYLGESGIARWGQAPPLAEFFGEKSETQRPPSAPSFAAFFSSMSRFSLVSRSKIHLAAR